MAGTVKRENLKLEALSVTDGVSITEKSGFSIIDAGVEAPGGWSAGKAAVEAAINSCGAVSFGDIYIKNYKLPTVDVYYDNTSGIKSTKEFAEDDITLFEAAGFAYIEGETLPDVKLLKQNEELQEYKTILTASPVSLTAAILSCCGPVPVWLSKLEASDFKRDEIFWAWSTTVVPVLSDDTGIMKSRKKAAAEYGSVVSFWVRTDDSKIQNFLESVTCSAELRIHNLSSARTFVKGSLDEAKLTEAFNL